MPPPRTRLLSGADWRFRTDPQLLGERFAEELNRTHSDGARWMDPSYDDSSWSTIAVPAAWQSAGHDHNGVAWYRRRFDAEPRPGERAFLRFDAADYFADVWLNGQCLGSHEGHAAPFGFEVTDALRADGNQLAVRVDSPRTAPGELHELGQLKTIFKGSLERTDTNDPELVPGGLTGDVALRRTGPVAIHGIRVRARPADSPVGERSAAQVEVEVRLDGPAGASATIHLRLEDGHGTAWHERTSTVRCSGAAQTVRLEIEASDVAVWWTWDLGAPALHAASVAVVHDGECSDQATTTFGVRSIARGEGWATYLNGIRIFQRGANYVCDQLQHLASDQRYARDVELMREANLNVAHPFCNVERPAFYDACDRLGLLVYQDFPAWMAVSDDSDVVRRALAVHAEIIDHLANHPSIAVWNCGSQATVANAHKLCSALARQARRIDPERIVNLANTVFATDDLDTNPARSFFWTQDRARTIERELDWRWDTHQYHGWYWGEATDVRELPEEELELVTEFGAQGLPRAGALREMLPGDAIWPPRWDAWARRCMQPELQLQRVELPDSLDELVAASQRYQARVVATHVEHYRRRRLRPCNGAHVFMFADFWPAITWAVLEYDRTPKDAFFALQRSMAPLQGLLVLPWRMSVGERHRAPAAIVNDRRDELAGALFRVTADGATIAEHVVDVPALAVIDLPDVEVRADADGELRIEADVHGADGEPAAHNEYVVEVDR